MKLCKGCNNYLLLSDFYKRPGGKDGVYTMCKPCYLYDKSIRNKNRNVRTIKSKKCNKCLEVKDATFYHKNNSLKGGISNVCKDCSYKNNLKVKYGIESLDHLLEMAENKCMICKIEFSGRPNIDHDHSCCPIGSACDSCVRGLLCSDCNHGLGKFKDSIVNLQNAILYLIRHSEKQVV